MPASVVVCDNSTLHVRIECRCTLFYVYIYIYVHRYGAPLIEYVLLSYLHVAVGVAILSHPIMERRMSLPLLQAAKTKQWAMATTFLWELELQAQGNSK